MGGRVFHFAILDKEGKYAGETGLCTYVPRTHDPLFTEGDVFFAVALRSDLRGQGYGKPIAQMIATWALQERIGTKAIWVTHPDVVISQATSTTGRDLGRIEK